MHSVTHSLIHSFIHSFHNGYTNEFSVVCVLQVKVESIFTYRTRDAYIHIYLHKSPDTFHSFGNIVLDGYIIPAGII
jgi:hypothetical protein